MGVGADGAILPATFAEDIDYSFAASPAVQVAGVSPGVAATLVFELYSCEHFVCVNPWGQSEDLIADKHALYT